jgi:hypothetical protein
MTDTNDQADWLTSRIEHFSDYEVIDMGESLIGRKINLDDRDAVIEAVRDEYLCTWDPLVLEEFVSQAIENARDFSQPSDMELWTEGVTILGQLYEAEKQRRKSCHERGERCAWEPYYSELSLWIERYGGASNQARHWWHQYWRAVHNPVWLASKARIQAAQTMPNTDSSQPTPEPRSELAECLWPIDHKLLDCTCGGKGFIWENVDGCVGRAPCPECGNNKTLAFVRGRLVGGVDANAYAATGDKEVPT